MTVPEPIRLTATADRHTYGTGYTIVVRDQEGDVLGGSCSDTVCPKVGTGSSWSNNPDPQPRTFYAELRRPDGVVVAVSDYVTVDVRKFVWNVLHVDANPPTGVVTGSINFTATVDRSVYGTGYQIHMYRDGGSHAVRCGNGTQCTTSVSRGWADNPMPQSGRVRVEVRGPNGDLASNTFEAEAPFRRYIFPVGLSFSSRTDSNGNVVHEATAATNRSMYGTSYRLKVKRWDGLQGCSTNNNTFCNAVATVGETYRAVVENGTGHVAGQSAAFTLTHSGPQYAGAGDVDLAALAVAAGSVDICTRLGLSPYRTNLVGPHTSGGDQWEACASAVAAGASTLAILAAVAETPGGEANLHWLEGDVTKEAPAEGTPASSGDAKAPRPIPPPFYADIQKLADSLASKQQVEQEVADDVAFQCAFLHWRAGKSEQRCESLPIFASGSDVAEATDHDLGALAGHWSWLRLNREHSGSKAGEGWQATGGRCSSTELRACHEYPFFGTEQGGPLATQNRSSGWFSVTTTACRAPVTAASSRLAK